MDYFISINQAQTDSCLDKIMDLILRGMNHRFHTGMIVVLRKAFQALDHTVFLQMMECIGFKESVFK